VTKKENESLKFALAEITRLNNQVMEATNAAKERELEAQKYRDRIIVLDNKLRNAQRSIDLSLANATADALRSATSAQPFCQRYPATSAIFSTSFFKAGRPSKTLFILILLLACLKFLLQK
jgi:hypothetical protein